MYFIEMALSYRLPFIYADAYTLLENIYMIIIISNLRNYYHKMSLISDENITTIILIHVYQTNYFSSGRWRCGWYRTTAEKSCRLNCPSRQDLRNFLHSCVSCGLTLIRYYFIFGLGFKIQLMLKGHPFTVSQFMSFSLKENSHTFNI